MLVYVNIYAYNTHIYIYGWGGGGAERLGDIVTEITYIQYVYIFAFDLLLRA